MLAKAGFSLGNPNDILCKPITRDSIYYNWKAWAKIKGVDRRLPAFTAAARSVKWLHMRQIFTANMPIIQEIDDLTGLSLFMLAAVGPTSDLESVYNLFREYPPVINLTNQIHLNSSTDRM